MNDNHATTDSYVHLANQAYGLVVDAVANSNQRALEYWKSVWEITSRPYASSAIETAVRENLDRTNQIVSLTVGEMQTTSAKTSELANKLFEHGAKLQESSVAAMRGVVNAGISNMTFVKDAAAKQFDEAGKRWEDAQPHAEPVSHN